MKRWAWLALALLCACSGGTTRPDQFQMVHSESVDVGGGPALPALTADGLNPAALGGGLTQDFSSTLQNAGAQKGDVQSVKLTGLRVEVTAPLRNGVPAQDLRFLDSLSMFIKAQGLAEVKVAQSLPPTTGTQSASFAVGVTSVDLPVLGVEVKDQVTADSMDARVQVTANGRPAFSCTVKITTTLDVKLNPVGAARNRLF